MEPQIIRTLHAVQRISPIAMFIFSKNFTHIAELPITTERSEPICKQFNSSPYSLG